MQAVVARPTMPGYGVLSNVSPWRWTPSTGPTTAFGFYAANATFMVTPTKVIGIDGADLVGSPTGWTFPSDRQ